MNFDVEQLFIQQIWQMSLLIAAAGLLTHFIGRRRPHLAYLVWMVVALKCLTPPIWSSPTSVFSRALANAGSHVDAVGSFSSSIVHGFPTEPLGVNSTLEAAMPVTDTNTAAIPEQAATSSVEGVGLLALLLAAWVGGAALHFGYMLLQWFRCAQFIRAGVRADDETQAIYQQQVDSSGLKRAPELVVVSESFGPAAIGCLHTKIIVPRAVIETADSENLKSIFAHELAHVRRGDIWYSWLQVAISCVWWFHPLVWYANRQIVCWREAACDEEVICQRSIKPRIYAEALLCVLESRARPFPAMQIGMATGEKTETRLARLMTQTKFCRRTPAWCWGVAVIASIVLLPGASMPLRAQDNIENGTTAAANDGEDKVETTADFTVWDGTPTDSSQNSVISRAVDVRGVATINQDPKRPVAIAEIELVRLRNNTVTSRTKTKTNDKGEFVFPGQKFTVDRSNMNEFERLFVFGQDSRGVRVWMEGLVIAPNGILQLRGNDVFIPLNGDKQKPAPQPPLNVAFSFPAKSATISGRVVDADGKPLSAATISVRSGPASEMNALGLSGRVVVEGQPIPPPPVSVIPDGMKIEATTDREGKWTIGSFGEHWYGEVAVRLDSADTASMTVARVNAGESIELAIPERRRLKFKVIDDATGKPVAAKVDVTRSNDDQSQWTTTSGKADELGIVHLNAPTGKLLAMLSPLEKNKQNYYRTPRQIEVGPSSDEITVKIRSASFATFRVVDADSGKPIPNIVASPERSFNLEHRMDASQVKNGVTVIRCVSGRAKFHLPAAGYKGFEVINPMTEPIELPPGGKFEYTFRIRKMKEFRPPVDKDNTAEMSAKHQEAVRQLRKLGAIVRTNRFSGKTFCHVMFTQFWKGTPSDLRWLEQLEDFDTLDSLTYPVPQEFRKTDVALPPVTDEWLPYIGVCKELKSISIEHSEITDAGLAHLKDKEILHLQISRSKIRGPGIGSLKRVTSLQLKGEDFDLAGVDISAAQKLRAISLESSARKPLAVPKLPSEIRQVMLYPANGATIDQLGSCSKLNFVRTGGPEITDEAIPSLSKLTCRQLTLVNASITDAGLKRLRKAMPKTHVEMVNEKRK